MVDGQASTTSPRADGAAPALALEHFSVGLIGDAVLFLQIVATLRGNDLRPLLGVSRASSSATLLTLGGFSHRGVVSRTFRREFDRVKFGVRDELRVPLA
jgi:hypothetical protein